MKPVAYGVVASVLMLSLYTAVLTYFNSFSHAIAQFLSIWPLMVLLVAGFGVQAGLFFYAREKIAERASAIAMASSGTVSTTSMIACCAHHITDVLPLIGFSFLAVIANRYQTFLISLGIVSNLLGTLVMLRMMQRHRITHIKNPVLKKLMKYDIDEVLKLSSVAGAALLAAMLLVA